ncbi:hypothetical protein FRC08_006744 [Ceratobasidium sp. 394]|nr:hypothetical protein FRC08_006744 [Ceratobasidium sp. 394]
MPNPTAFLNGPQVVKDTDGDPVDPPTNTTHTSPRDAPTQSLEALIDHSIHLLDRFQNGGSPDCLNESIAGLAHATGLTPTGDTTRAPLLHNLGLAYFQRFMCFGEESDIDQSIASWTEGASLTPDEHPDKLDRVNNLGNSYLQKFQRLGDPLALNNAISTFESAVSLAPHGHGILSGLHNNLGNGYSIRFELLGKDSDIDQAILHQLQSVSLTPEDHPARPGWLRNLGSSLILRFERQGQLADINTAIDCLAEAVSQTPDNHTNRPGRLSNLGTAYQRRFEHSGEVSDIDEAISCHAQAVSIVPEGSPEKSLWLSNLGVAYACRSLYLQNVEDTEKGIRFQEEALSLCPAGDARTFVDLASNLGGLYLSRFMASGNLADLDQSIEYTSQSVSVLPDNHPRKHGQLNNLAIAFRKRFGTSHEKSDLDQAISLHHQVLSLVPDDHPNKHHYLGDLGNAHYTRYHISEDDIEDLNLAAMHQEQGLIICPENHPFRAWRLEGFANTILTQFNLTHDPASLEAVRSLLEEAAASPSSSSFIRFNIAHKWAYQLADNLPEQSFRGWRVVMDLLPSVVWIGHTVGRRYQYVANITRIVAAAISAAITRQHYATALEWLEEGRAIIWKQILQLRTPVDDLRAVDPELASQLELVSRSLEQAGNLPALDTPPSREIDRIVPAEQVIQRRHRLAKEWDELVSRVRDIPSFENFLRPKKIGELAAATHSGPVITIHVHESTCGALLLLPGSAEVTHLSLPDFSYDKAMNAYNRLKHLLHDSGMRDSAQRKFVKHSVRTENPFGSVLELLWKDVVKPVLDVLGYTKNPRSSDLPHVTWCTTGPLSFLPLHAAGLYADKTSEEKIFNYVVSSYTPSLSALLASNVISGEFGGILAVGQSATPGQTPLPGAVEELERITQQFGEMPVVRLEGDAATVDSVVSTIENHSWVHLACHGSQNSAAPGTSSFYLHDGPLTLSTIMSKSLKNAEFAFLSACQTASGDEDLPDEAVHLAAGMLMAGYRTVIATTWPICDADAPFIAEKVYAHMIQGGRPDSRRAAQALHLAVTSLRDRVGEGLFLSWVPYIHIGI